MSSCRYVVIAAALACLRCSCDDAATRRWTPPPSTPVVRIEPASPRTADALVAVRVEPSVAAEGREVVYGFRWIRSGVVQEDLVSPSVPADRTTRGEVWRVEVTPTAEGMAGLPAAAEVLIGNTSPSLLAVSFGANAPKDGDDLEAVPSGGADADDDVVTYRFRWFVDGAVVDDVTGATLPASRHGLNHRVRVEVAPFDGTDEGAVVSSAEMVVGPAFVGCGNGLLEPDEACDDGNVDSTDLCTALCRFEACGDGFVGPDESCDDGNRDDGDACPATCGPLRLAVGGQPTWNGDNFLCRLDAAGRLLCWGRNDHGQLGLGDTRDRYEAIDLAQLVPVDFGAARRVVDVGLGRAFGCVLLDDGSVKCWGANASGQLGLGDTLDRGTTPGQMGDALPGVALGSGRHAKQLSVGEATACVIRDDDTLVCWGASGNSGLLLGSSVAVSEARGAASGEMGDALAAVDVGAGRTAARVFLSRAFERVFVLRDDGSLVAFGLNLNGELGLEVSGPVANGTAPATVRMPAGTSVVDVVGDAVTSCAVLSDGTSRCWGIDPGTQLVAGAVPRGASPGTMGDALVPMQFGTSRRPLTFAVGEKHGCALLDDRSIKCWGENYYYESSSLQAQEPDAWQTGLFGDGLLPLELGTSARPVDVVVSRAFSCALFDAGEVRCWGDAGPGLFGRGAAGGDRARCERPDAALQPVALAAAR